MDIILVAATVEAYVPDAMTDEFDAGQFLRYDAAVLRVDEPDPWTGRMVQVMFDRPAPTDSFWRQPGTCLRFAIAEEHLDGDALIGIGALQNVEIIAAE